MAALKLALLSLAGLAAGAPVASPDSFCGTKFPTSFHLYGHSANGTVYPLAATFPAIFDEAGTNLQLYASMSSPYNLTGTTPFTYNATGQYMSTPHTARANPDGPAVTFNTPVQTAGSPIVFKTDQTNTSSHFDTYCFFSEDQIYYNAFASKFPTSYSFALCDGDSVDQELDRKTLYLNPATGDSGCIPVDLYPVAA